MFWYCFYLAAFLCSLINAESTIFTRNLLKEKAAIEEKSLLSESEVTETTCKTEKSNCTETGGFCTRDADGAIQCDCPIGDEYVEATGCTVTEMACNAQKSKCTKTGGSCIRDADSVIHCKCPTEDGYDKYRGCTVSESICKAEQPMCIETLGVCIRDKTHSVECRCYPIDVYDGISGCTVYHASCDGLEPNCRSTGGSCFRDANAAIYCKCPKGGDYHKLTGCRVLNTYCKDHKPKCIETGGRCEFDAEQNTQCICKEKLDYKENIGCKANFCVEVCGDKPDIFCYDEVLGKDSIKCGCRNKNQLYNPIKKICEVPDDYCKNHMSKCIETEGRCEFDAEQNIQCICTKGIEYKPDLGCKANFCVEICGDKPNVLCYGDVERRDAIKCACYKKNQIFNPKKKICEVADPDADCKDYKPKCIETGGRCKFDSKQNIHCICPGKIKYEAKLGCKVPDADCEDYNPKCNETGGRCVFDSKQNIHCICPGKIEYEAKLGCEDPCKDYPCQNGGTCFIYHGAFKCSCEIPFAGKTCETRTLDNIKTWTVVIWILCSIIILLILTIGCLLVSRCLKKKNGAKSNC